MKIISILFILTGLIGTITLTHALGDILQGKSLGLKMAPITRMNTDNGALTIIIVMLCASFFIMIVGFTYFKKRVVQRS